jgi:hypothetical protein
LKKFYGIQVVTVSWVDEALFYGKRVRSVWSR